MRIINVGDCKVAVSDDTAAKKDQIDWATEVLMHADDLPVCDRLLQSLWDEFEPLLFRDTGHNSGFFSQ